MATPIKDTPILTGKHALRFQEEVKRNENKKVSPESYKRGEDAFKNIKTKENRNE